MRKTIKVEDMVKHLAFIWSLKEKEEDAGEQAEADMYFHRFVDIVDAMLDCLYEPNDKKGREKGEDVIERRAFDYYFDNYLLKDLLKDED